MSKFQIILVGIFGLFVLAGIIVFAFYKGHSGPQLPPVVVWGTIPQSEILSVISKLGKAQVEYVEKQPATFVQELTNALASGFGPDAILASQDVIIQEQNKFIQIPYTTYPKSQYQAIFIPESDLFLTDTSILALPFSIDPLVMYWNKDIFSNAGYSQPPLYWDQFSTVVPNLTIKDKAFNISQSAVGLGGYSNIDHAKDILSLLLFQSGSQIVIQKGTDMESAIGTTGGSGQSEGSSPAVTALNFYTQFTNPTVSTYTWNASLLDSANLFLANRLGLYFGLASESNIIAEKNPNLNFSVAVVPQIRPGTANYNPNKITFGELYGLAIVRTSAYPSNTLADLELLSGQAIQSAWTKVSGQPSVRLDSLTPDPTQPNSSVFSSSALWARGWYDPYGAATNQVFGVMVNTIVSGLKSTPEAITDADSALQNLLNALK